MSDINVIVAERNGTGAIRLCAPLPTTSRTSSSYHPARQRASGTYHPHCSNACPYAAKRFVSVRGSSLVASLLRFYRRLCQC